MAKLLNKFLGTARWQQLWEALREASEKPFSAALGIDSLFVALVISTTPILVTYWDELRPPETPSTIYPTVAFGICAVLAFLCRSRLGLTAQTGRNFRESLQLTHTAFALGCVPAAIVLCLSKTLLADRHDTLAVAVHTGPASGSPYHFVTRLGLLLAIAAWVAVTEEVIFRGMLVSVIRRLKYLPSQKSRDIAAAVVSAVIFGLAHWWTWGPLAAIALVGLGVGFVLGYIANGERLATLILYHFIFDSLSLAIGVGL